MALKAIIFDFDGVILDSETPEYQLWQAILARYGVPLPLEEWERGLGSSPQAFDPLDYLEQQLGAPVARVTLKAEHRRLLLEQLANQGPMPGIRETLEAATLRGTRLAVASSSGLGWVEGYLTRLELRHYFQALCTAEDVAQVKPDPALYCLALQRLDVTAQEALVIEDSPNGIRAARAAGIFCLAVPTVISRQLDLSAANVMAPSLTTLAFEQLMALVAG
jgi:HAD superfamily hydrolase (TIGR01509 family)